MLSHDFSSNTLDTKIKALRQVYKCFFSLQRFFSRGKFLATIFSVCICRRRRRRRRLSTASFDNSSCCCQENNFCKDHVHVIWMEDVTKKKIEWKLQQNIWICKIKNCTSKHSKLFGNDTAKVYSIKGCVVYGLFGFSHAMLGCLDT